MKGVIFNLVEEVVAAAFGPEMWERLLDTADASGVYTSLGSYPDQELLDIVGAACTHTRMAAPELLRTIGTLAIPRMYARFPHFFDGAPDARSFVLSLNGIIHPEVRKLYAGAGCPHFHYTQADAALTLGYNSPRKLCHLAEGFLIGAAGHYGEAVTVSQSACMHSGDPACHIHLAWD